MAEQDLNRQEIAGLVSARTGVPLQDSTAPPGTIKLRPSEVRPGRGFTILAHVNINSAEAELVPDGLASALVRSLRQGIKADSTVLDFLIEQKKSQGWTVSVQGFRGEEDGNPRIRVRSRPQPGTNPEGLLAEAASLCLALMLAMTPGLAVPADHGVPGEDGATEGDVRDVILTTYERDPRNRALCLAIHGTSCMACGFDFGARYGPVAAGSIHVHHRTPLHRQGGPKRVDPRTDLIPLCPNCHLVAHLRPNPYSPDEIKKMIADNVARSG